MIKRKRLCGLSTPEFLDIALTSLDCGRDCCSAVCGGCSNVWDSMMRVKVDFGRYPRGRSPNMFEFRVDKSSPTPYRSRAEELGQIGNTSAALPDKEAKAT